MKNLILLLTLLVSLLAVADPKPAKTPLCVRALKHLADTLNPISRVGEMQNHYIDFGFERLSLKFQIPQAETPGRLLLVANKKNVAEPLELTEIVSTELSIRLKKSEWLLAVAKNGNSDNWEEVAAAAVKNADTQKTEVLIMSYAAAEDDGPQKETFQEVVRLPVNGNVTAAVSMPYGKDGDTNRLGFVIRKEDGTSEFRVVGYTTAFEDGKWTVNEKVLAQVALPSAKPTLYEIIDETGYHPMLGIELPDQGICVLFDSNKLKVVAELTEPRR